MPNFIYKAITENGTTVSGTLEADSLTLAESMLVNRGYIPSKIRQGKTGAQSGLSALIKKLTGGVKISDLILFTKQFRSMYQAGISIMRLLQVLESQTQNRTLKDAAAALTQDIKKGASIFQAMEKHPKIFSPLYRSMINAGEVSGTLPEVLERLIFIIEHEAKIKADIRAALQYPVIVLIALAIAFFVLLTFVIPKFVVIFASAGITLPLPTKIAMMLYEFLKNYWYVLLGTVAGLIFGIRSYVKTDQGKYIKDALILRLPLFGPLFIKAIMARFASIFAILQSSGIPVIAAMDILSGTIGNSAVSRQFVHVKDRVTEGQGIAGPLSSAKFFTPMVIDMIVIGEESGNIDEMLRHIAVHYDDEVSYAVKKLSDAVGPILMVGLAGVVGFFALAIFMPMWDLTKMAK